MVAVGVLGEVTAWNDGRAVNLGTARQRCILAVLAVDLNRVVPFERIIERVWGESPPLRVRNVVSSYISRLRGALAPVDGVELRHRPGGYVLVADEALVDLHRFRELRALRSAEQALGLWRGEALTGLGSDWALLERERLHGERFAVECDLVDARLDQGQGEELLAELTVRVAEHPLDERVAAQYMLALYRADRPSDALKHYARMHARMVEELGTDPGAALRDLHRGMLETDPMLDPAPRAAVPAPVPRQLPAQTAHFSGRVAELDELSAFFDGVEPGGAPVVCAITGAGGIGKTSLALRWAHRHADRFPGGQLFVDLQGFSATAAPVDPSTALRGFLEALGVAPQVVPADQQARSALFRSLVADRRVLVVLDNARDSSQVSPLLPGSGTSAVLITSRNRLTTLVSRHAARVLTVRALSAQDAGQALTTRLSADRVAAEPEAARELLAWCGGIPLALAIVAGRAASYPEFPLAVLAGQLRDAATRLDVLSDDDPTASLPAVLSWSCDALTARQARMFALLGLVPGTDVGLAAAARLADLPVAETRAVLRGLEDVHLVQQHAPGRWRMHDLVRLYAADRARHDVPAEVADTARRLIGFYLHSALAAERVLEPNRPPIRPDATVPREGSESPADAMRWFATEHHNLRAVQQLAAEHGHRTAVWQLAWSLDTFHYRQGLFHDAVVAWRAGLAAAEHDPATRALAHRLLGDAASYAGLPEEAETHLVEALAVAESLDDRAAQALTHHALAWSHDQQERPQQALWHAMRALHLFQELDEPAMRANALSAVGWYQAQVGDYDQARAHCDAAVDLARRHDNRQCEAATTDTLGHIDRRTGDHSGALEHHRRALTLFRELGNSHMEATTLDHIGSVHDALGHRHRARAAWRQALELYLAQHRAEDAQSVQLRLDDSTPSSSCSSSGFM